MLANLNLPRWTVWGLVIPVLFLNLWLLEIISQQLQPIPKILLVAGLLAFLLNFPISYLEKLGVNRIWCVLLVLIIAVTAFLILVFCVAPIVYQQLIEFGDRLPALIDQGQRQIQEIHINIPLAGLSVDAANLITEVTNKLTQILESLPSQIVDFLFGVFDSTLNLLITIVLTILLIFNGSSLWNALFKLFPKPWNIQVPSLIQQSFQNYFAGQATLAMIEGTALIALFLVFQIPFGLLFGLVIGIASFIPFGGTVTVSLVLPILAIQNIWLAVKLLVIVVLVGQINETIVAPRLMGQMTGVNPAVIFISLLCGAKLGGVLGILLAVPLTSLLKRFAEPLFNTDELGATTP